MAYLNRTYNLTLHDFVYLDIDGFYSIHAKGQKMLIEKYP